MGQVVPLEDIPKIQDGFSGPGISLIVESLRRPRRRIYTKAAVQAASAPS